MGRTCIFCFCFAVFVPEAALADLFDIAIEDGRVVATDSGVSYFDILVRRRVTDEENPSLGFLNAQISLMDEAGGVLPFSATGATVNNLTPTGELGGTGVFAAANLSSASKFVFETSDPSLAVLDLFFNSPVQISTTFSRVARASVNVDGLASGRYVISIDDAFFGSTAATIKQQGAFTVTAVPEPSSVALVLVSIISAFLCRRRQSVESEGPLSFDRNG